MTSLDREKLAAAYAVFSKEGGVRSAVKTLLTKILPMGAKRGGKTIATKIVPKAAEKAVTTVGKKVGGKGAKTIATKIVPKVESIVEHLPTSAEAAAWEASRRPGYEAIKGTAKTVARKGGGKALRSVGKGLAAGGALAGLGAGAYALGKGKKMPALDPSLFMPPQHIRPDLYAPPPAQEEDESGFSEKERRQFARHGLDPERLKFLRTLGAYRQGMNLDRKLFEQALAGKLPAGVLGGGGEDEGDDLEAYA